MSGDPKTVSEGTRCEVALEVLQQYRITAVFVTAHDDPARPVGLVHIHDLARLKHG
jgi:arabinose-5-phosphate isomerase